jgi:rubredoxin
VDAVELHQAFLWTCEECGRDNFERAITIAPESIDPDDLPSVLGLEPEEVKEWMESGGGGSWTTAPTHVCCPHCEARFRAE